MTCHRRLPREPWISHPSCRTHVIKSRTTGIYWKLSLSLRSALTASSPKPAGSFIARFSMGDGLIGMRSALALISRSYTSSLTNSQKPHDQIPGHYSRKGTPLWSTAAVSYQLKSAPRFCRPPLCRHPGGLPGPMLAMSKTQEMLMEMLKWHAEGILVNKATLRGWGRRLSSLPWRELQ